LLSEEFVLDESRRVLLGWILEAGQASGQALFDSISKRDRNSAESLSEWLVDAPDVEQIEYAFREVSGRLKEFALERLILTKKAGLRALDAVKDATAYDGLFREVVTLERQRNALRTRMTQPADGRVE